MRITPVAPGTQPALAEIEATIAASRGKVGPLYQTLLASPPMAVGWEKLLTAVRQHNSLPEALREMLILRVAVLTGCTNEYGAHLPIALQAGATQQQIDALQDPAALGTAFSAAEQALLTLADTMTRSVAVPDALFAQVRSHYEERQVVDALVTIASYNMVTRFVVAAAL